MNKAFRSLWVRQSLLNFQSFHNAPRLLTQQFQMSAMLNKVQFGFSEFYKKSPRQWEGSQSQSHSYGNRGESNHSRDGDEARDYNGSDPSNRRSYERRSSEGRDRGNYSSNRDSRYARAGDSRPFTQPTQSEIPESIKKNILDQFKVGTNAHNHNDELHKLHKIFIKQKNEAVKEENFLNKFEELALPKEINDVLEKENFLSPSPIQSVAIPYILRGDDMINLAQTGSGKTLAFVIPAILHIMNQSPTRFPRVLVIAPTRELAMQIHGQFNLFSNIITSTCVYGGHPKSLQQRQLSYKNDVIIATPGRLQDFIEDGFPLTTITQVILDEADRMLDMGFEPQIRDILNKVRQDKQTLFFSATWPKEVQFLAQDLCQQNPNIIRIGSDGMTLNKDINQSVCVLHSRDKPTKFLEILKDYQNTKKKVLVFCQRKSDTEKVEDMVNETGMSATSLHGDLTQRDRDHRMRQFKNGDSQVLIATNLASRGLDIQDIELVNYDFPDSIEDYIHRIGRTGRAGRTGTAISLIPSNFSKKKVLLDLIKVLKQTNQQVSQQLQQLAYNHD